MTACLPRYRSRMPVLILLTLMATWQFGRNDAIAYASPATHKKRYRKEHPGSIDQRIHAGMLGIDIRPDFRLACAGGGPGSRWCIAASRQTLPRMIVLGRAVRGKAGAGVSHFR